MGNNMHNKNFGFDGEAIAKKHYEKQGWSFIAQNLTEKGSEIDLIFKRNITNTNQNDISQETKQNNQEEILFIEVKSMEIDNKDNLTPEDNFTKSKQRFLKRGVDLYLTKNKLYNTDIEIRIDLVCIYYHKKGNKYSIKIYENIILD